MGVFRVIQSKLLIQLNISGHDVILSMKTKVLLLTVVNCSNLKLFSL